MIRKPLHIFRRHARILSWPLGDQPQSAIAALPDCSGCRRKPQRRDDHVDGFLDQVADTKQTIEEVLTGNNCDPVVAQIIASLKPQSRELLYMVYVDQLPHEEIGRRLGVGTGATRSRVHRLCQHLKRAILIQKLGPV